MTDRALLLCPQCDATTWHPTGYLKGATHLCYLWCSQCAAREQDEFLAIVSAAAAQVTLGAGSTAASTDPGALLVASALPTSSKAAAEP